MNPADGSPNYTPTSDPKVVMGKHGVPITYDEFVNANKNGYAWKDFPAYADYVGGWAKPIENPIPVAPYYRAYAQKDPIHGADIAVLMGKHNPDINKILTRNIAPAGEVPMFGSADADMLRALITKEKVQAAASSDPNYGLANAMANAKGK